MIASSKGEEQERATNAALDNTKPQLDVSKDDFSSVLIFSCTIQADQLKSHLLDAPKLYSFFECDSLDEGRQRRLRR